MATAPGVSFFRVASETWARTIQVRSEKKERECGRGRRGWAPRCATFQCTAGLVQGIFKCAASWRRRCRREWRLEHCDAFGGSNWEGFSYRPKCGKQGLRARQAYGLAALSLFYYVMNLLGAARGEQSNMSEWGRTGRPNAGAAAAPRLGASFMSKAKRASLRLLDGPARVEVALFRTEL